MSKIDPVLFDGADEGCLLPWQQEWLVALPRVMRSHWRSFLVET